MILAGIGQCAGCVHVCVLHLFLALETKLPLVSIDAFLSLQTGDISQNPIQTSTIKAQQEVFLFMGRFVCLKLCLICTPSQKGFTDTSRMYIKWMGKPSAY